MPPLVSVIIPVYNKPAAFIREAIGSVLGQTYEPLEVIVVDDGSSQDLSWLRSAYGERITLARKPNGGPASARNHGVGLARGAYLAFLDADDAWEPGKLEAQIAALERRPQAGLSYSAVAAVDAQGRPCAGPDARKRQPSGAIFETLFWRNVIPTSTVVVRRECFNGVGLFDEAPALISVEDYDMWLRIAERYEVACLEQPLVRYRRSAEGISRNIARSYAGERLVIEKAMARNAQATPHRRARLRRRLAQIAFDCGHEYFSANDLASARAQFREARRQQPWSLRAWGFWAATFLRPQHVEVVRRLKGRRPAAANGRHRQQRVMHVLFSVETGGAEHVVLNLATHRDRANLAMFVCSLTGRGALAEAFVRADVPVVAMGKRPGVDLPLIWRLARLFRRERIDVVHTHNVTPWLYAGLAARLAGARLVHTEHSNLFPHQRRLMAAERWLSRWTETVISDSEKVRGGLLRQGLEPSRVTTVMNGIDTARFSAPADAAAARAGLRMGPAQPVVGAVGRLVPVKDHATLLKAFALVHQQVPDAVLVLVGGGPLREALEQQASALGVSAHVRFAGEQPDVAAFLPLFDVFALSSVSEGMPLTLLEAMAAGKPAVATRVGGIPEAVVDGQTGLLVPAGDAPAMAQALLNVLADPARRQRMGEQARRRAHALFDIHRMVETYERTYHH